MPQLIQTLFSPHPPAVPPTTEFPLKMFFFYNNFFLKISSNSKKLLLLPIETTDKNLDTPPTPIK